MGKYIHKFNTVSEFNDYRNENYKQPWLSYTVENNKVDYNHYTSEEYAFLSIPFTIEALDTGTITWNLAENKTIKYSKNGSEYQTWDGTIGIDVVKGDEVAFLGNNQVYYIDNTTPSIVCTSNFNAKGNIMSLIKEANFWEEYVLTEDLTFANFLRQQPVVSAENLLLPATTLTKSCYANLFIGSSLVYPPKTLPALVAANNCYQQMFYGCTSLTELPELPATTLTDHCYQQMFMNCTGITSIPDNYLPATTLNESCYLGMFYNTGIISISTNLLSATTLAERCYSNMFQNCTNLTNASINLPVMTMAISCYESMFDGCVNLTVAPQLPATTLASRCYQMMFAGCSSLTTAPDLPALTLVDTCYQKMFQNCTNLNYVTCLATDISATNCVDNWLYGVAETGTFKKAAEMSNWTTGVSGIPEGWTVETASS